jgi:hypothetical protein
MQDGVLGASEEGIHIYKKRAYIFLLGTVFRSGTKVNACVAAIRNTEDREKVATVIAEIGAGKTYIR